MRARRSIFFILCLCGALWGDLSEKERELKAALAAKDRGRVVALSQELLAMGEPRAVELVARQALLIDSHEAERQIAGLLAALPLELRGPVQKEAKAAAKYQVRVILAAVLAAYDDETSFVALCSMVSDPNDSVQMAAISQLIKRRDVRAIDALIDEYAKREGHGGVVAGDLRRALKELTGQDFPNAANWKKWWNTHRAAFKGPAQAGPPSPSESVGHTQVLQRSFFGHEIVSKKILFILDVSDSMHLRDEPIPDPSAPPEHGTTVVKEKKGARGKGKDEKGPEEKLPLSRQRLYRVQQELMRTIDNLDADTRFTVMAFNHKIKLLSDSPQLATPSFRKKAKDFARAFRHEGETHTDTALEQAFKMKGQIDTIYLLSDGAPRRNNKLLDVAPILKAVKETNRFSKIKIYTVGFLQAGRRMRAFLNELSRQNDGEYKDLR